MPTLITHWQRALALLDQALALQPEQRETWLAHTAASEPDAVLLLRKLLLAHGRIETHALLATLPKVARSMPLADGGVAGMTVGPFELIEPLGRGGMGSVWRARYADGRLKRDVAIKLPASTDDPSALATLRERFARERDFLAQLEHPNIARLYDAGVSDTGQPFLAMEYVAGRAIDEYCDAERLTVKARLQLFEQVLEAVAYAHQQLVLHRDLKADNVLVDAQGRVRLLDFGVARLLPPPSGPGEQQLGAQAELTERAGAAFTMGYAAPEQINHGALSTATDVYALGVLLYRLLTGLSPYQPLRDTRGGLEDAVLLAVPEAASSRAFLPTALELRQSTSAALRKALRNDLDVILGKALKKLPNERYATVAALADDVHRHLAQLPISARADRWRYRTGLFVARHRLAVAASALVSVALIATTGVAAWQAKVSTENAARASKEAARANAAQKFFAGLLSNADPEKNKNISAVDRQVLDQALATAERDFADAPDTLLIVLKQMGDIYFRIGLHPKHLEVQRKRLATVNLNPGVAVDELVDIYKSLAMALGRSNDATESGQAMMWLQRARDTALTRKASAPLLVQVLCLISDQLLDELKFSEADLAANQALAQAKALLPNPHPDLAWAYEQKAATASKLGDLDTARAFYRSALSIDATEKGRNKVDQLTARANLANFEFRSGNYQASKQEALAALEYARQNLGTMEATLTQLRVRVVLAAERAGELDEASRLAVSLLQADLNSSDGFQAGRAQFAMGAVAMARGEFAAAARAFAQAQSLLAGHVGWPNAVRAQQATLHLKLGENMAASRLLTEPLDRLRKDSGVGSDEFARLAELMGVALLRQGEPDQARALFSSACARWRVFRADLPNRIRCEAYATLAAEDQDMVQQRRALVAQQTLMAGRTDHMALAAALQSALNWLDRPEQGGIKFASFPLLD